MLNISNNPISLGKLFALVFALVVTIGLLFTMHLLIRMAQPALDRGEQFVMPKFVHVPEPEPVSRIKPPEKPPEVQEKPDVPEQEVRPSSKLNALDINLATKVSINKSNKIGLTPSDGEYLPIVKIAPVYPRRASERCLEGYVVVKFTVTTSGSVENPVVVESSSRIFERSAKKAASQFKYKPRTVDGVAIAVPNVTNKITYKIAGGCR